MPGRSSRPRPTRKAPATPREPPCARACAAADKWGQAPFVRNWGLTPFLLRFELQRYAVHAVTLPGGLRAIFEHVTEVAAAVGAMHFDARHAVGAIGGGRDGVRQRAEEARPARATLVLGAGLEQRPRAAGAVVDAGALLVVERTGAGALGAVLTQYAELVGREQRAPLGVGFLHREILVRHLGYSWGLDPTDRECGDNIAG